MRVVGMMHPQLPNYSSVRRSGASSTISHSSMHLRRRNMIGKEGFKIIVREAIIKKINYGCGILQILSQGPGLGPHPCTIPCPGPG